VGYDTVGTPPSYESSIAITYDAGNRVTEIEDSVGGIIGRTYDDYDRLTQEETADGTIEYTYDGSGRRATMTVDGQTAVSYTYDDADRLTGITQGTAAVTITYDAANRRTALALANGVVVEYAYDDASHPTDISYKLSGTTFGELAYTYNLGGQRTSLTGSFARSALPAALSSATYDDANQVLTFGGGTFSYDDNGSLL
jgi:YD repeat-containing protein